MRLNWHGVQRFSYNAQGKVVAVDYSTNGGSSYTTYYYLRNAQGDIVKLIDNGGDTKVEYTYDSWGKILATTGSLATSLGANQPFRYRGYVYDTETGWYYLQSRYYNPETCRFISSDVLLSTGQGVIGHNSYAYCLNNPVNGHDSNGEAFRPNDYSQECTDSGRGNRYKQWCFKPWRYERESGRYSSAYEAAKAWGEKNKPLSETNERMAVIFEMGGSYFCGPTFTGSPDNVIVPTVVNWLAHTVLECGTPDFRGIIRVAGHVHTHPKPAEGDHNDYPSYKGPGNNGDVLLHTLLGYPEAYIIPYESCCGIEVIVLSDRSTWCPNH